MQNAIENIKYMKWHQVYSTSASSNLRSGNFELKGSSVRVMWYAEGVDSSAWVSFDLYFSNGTGLGDWSSSGVKTGNNAVLELSESGNYYLDITSSGTSYSVGVWDYY